MSRLLGQKKAAQATNMRGQNMKGVSMQHHPYRKQPEKSNLKLLAGGKADELRLGGIAPSEDMAPDKYLVVCETAWIQAGSKNREDHTVVFQFRVVDGKYDGVGLRQWVTAANGGGVISPTSRYAVRLPLAGD